MQTEYRFERDYIKQAIKKRANCDKLKQACDILESDTGVPSYTWYTFSNGSISYKYLIFMVNYLMPYICLHRLFRCEELNLN